MNGKNILIGSISALAFAGFVGSIVSISLFGLNGCEYGGSIDDGPYNPGAAQIVEQKEGNFSKFDYAELARKELTPLTPSKGNVNVLVVPVEFSDLDKFNTIDIAAINSAFNGINENHKNNKWESTKSFYEKSSNGQLNFNFEICDPYVPSISSTMYSRFDNEYGAGTSAILEEILNKGLTKENEKINLQDNKYDINKDGYIDGVWLIYNAKDRNKVYGNPPQFWAYTANFIPEDKMDPTKNIFGRYANASILFLDDRGYAPSDASVADAHTLIHETGHMIGLDDYYDYANGQNQYSFTGQLDMMDLNIGDHNAYSKYALGWIKAKVVDESQTLTLKPFSTSYDSLILPSGSYNGSAFSEYIMVEYYTPENLYSYDSRHNYAGTYPEFYSKSGLRIYHIDARLSYFKAIQDKFTGAISYKFGDYLDKNIQDIPKYNDRVLVSTIEADWVVVGHTNSPIDKTRNKDGKPLIELVSSRNEKLYNSRGSTNKDLYISNNSDGYAFSASNQSRYFDSNKFNDGSLMNYKIKINGTNEEGINLTIEVE